MRLREGLLYAVVFGPGFGESIILRVPPATWVVVDGCTLDGRSAPAGLLADQEATWSCVVLTHPHQDHALGLDEVLEHPADRGTGLVGCADPRLADPRSWEQSNDPETHLRLGTVEHLLAAIHDRWERYPDARWILRRGDQRQVGDAPNEATITVLHPDEDTVRSRPADPNRLSTGMLVQWQDVFVLLGSDLVSDDWRAIGAAFQGLRNHNVLKIPHHGSSGSVHECFGEGDVERFWIVTPFNRGRTLPRFENGEGIAWALRHVNAVHVTGLAVRCNLGERVPYETTRQGLLDGTGPPLETHALPGGLTLRMRPELGGDGVGRSFVAVGFTATGDLADVQHGPGAVVVRN